jgi:hypothetical protein
MENVNVSQPGEANWTPPVGKVFMKATLSISYYKVGVTITKSVIPRNLFSTQRQEKTPYTQPVTNMLISEYDHF